MRIILASILLSLFIPGCRRNPPKAEETPTKGRLFLLATESHQDIMKQGAEEYGRMYPEVSVEVAPVSTREAIVHFLNDSVKCICVDRPLNEEELEVAKKAELLYTENKIAEDALVIIVHPKNPAQHVLFQDLREIVSGVKKSWNSLTNVRWPVTIDLALTGRNSGAYELLQRYFFKISGDLSVTSFRDTQTDVVDYVRTHPEALGIVSIAAVRNNSSAVKVLAVESAMIAEERFVTPSQINIYRSLYPLRYSLYLYTSESSTAVAAGFTTFMKTMQGQKVIQNSGLVPVVIPNRIIQLNTE